MNNKNNQSSIGQILIRNNNMNTGYLKYQILDLSYSYISAKPISIENSFNKYYNNRNIYMMSLII